MKWTSQTTFIYVDDLPAARFFFEEILRLEVVYDPLWACVWRIGQDSFLGAVDKQSQRGLIQDEIIGGTLISFTVQEIETVYSNLKSQKCIEEISPIRYLEDIGLKSFLFTGPEGFKFEIQEFTNVELKNLF